MDLENIQWYQADQDFNLWLNGNNIESNLPHSDILRSIFLAFRQKQIQRLSSFCKQAFEYYQEQENIRRQKLRLVQESWFEDNNIYFKRSFYSESERKARTKRENQIIIDGILLGDQTVFNSLYEYEFPKVVNLIIKNSGSVEMARDVFQDAIVRLMEKVYTKKLDLTCSVKTYLYSICKYLWLDQLRQNKREKQMIAFYDKEFNSDDISVHFYNTPDIFENVNMAINTLGDPCKQLLECYYYQNLSWDEIATKLGYSSAASARNQKYKCLERIRSKVNVEVD
jgi:RNA polymerase sigma factor (sigma-70 family)